MPHPLMTSTEFGPATTPITLMKIMPHAGWIDLYAYFPCKLPMRNASDVASVYSKASDKIFDAMMEKGKEEPLFLLSSSHALHLPIEDIKKYFRDFVTTQLFAALYHGTDLPPQRIMRSGTPVGAVEEWFQLHYLMGWSHSAKDESLNSRSMAVAIERVYDMPKNTEVFGGEDMITFQWFETDVISF